MLITGLVPLVACVDAKARFDQFGERIPIDATPIDAVDAPMVDMIPNIDGMWLVAVDPKPISAGSFIQITATWDITSTGSSGTLDGSYQPLTTFGLPPDSPNRVPVGPGATPAVLVPLIANDVAVDNTASFAANLVGTLPGPSNTVSGTEFPVDITLHATIRSTTLVCGTVTGMVGPLGVAGSTFAAIPAGSPLPFPLAECPASGLDAGVDAP